MDDHQIDFLNQVEILSSQILEMLKKSIPDLCESSSTLQVRDKAFSPSACDDRLRKIIESFVDKGKRKADCIEEEDKEELSDEMILEEVSDEDEEDEEGEQRENVGNVDENRNANISKKRRRSAKPERYSEEQQLILKKVYEKKKHIATKERERLAKILEKTPRQITVWFQNQRSRDEKHPLHPRTLIKRGQSVPMDLSVGDLSEEDEQEEEEGEITIASSTTTKSDLISTENSFIEIISSPLAIENEKEDNQFDWEFSQTLHLQPFDDDVLERIDRDIAELNAYSQSIYSNFEGESSFANTTSSTISTTTGSFMNESFASMSSFQSSSTSNDPIQSPQIDLSLFDLPFDDFMNFDFDNALKVTDISG